MSRSLHTWYSLQDLEAFGVRRVTLSGELATAKMSRLADLLHADDGSVKVSLSFRQRSDGGLTLELAYEATLELTCQRCLEPLRRHVAERIEMAVVGSESMASALPSGHEPLELDDGALLPAQLIEDELIVSIPLVPKHERIEECGTLARELGSTEAKAAQRAPDL